MVINEKIIDDLKSLVGEKNVLTRPGDTYVYSFDAALDRGMPGVVILPNHPTDISKIVRVLVANKIPYVARGAATSLCGGPVPVNGGAVIVMSRLKGMGMVDKKIQEVSVEPGVVNLRLQEHLNPTNLFWPPDPGSQKACTVGGNISTNAGGPHCLKYGVTSNNVLGLTMVMPDGQPARYNVEDPGYDLTGFFVGSEGTLGLVTGARLKLLTKPKFVRTMVVSFSSMEAAIQSVTDIIAAGILPATLEAMDRTIVEAVEAFVNAGYPVDAEAVLLIEVDGDRAEELDQQVDGIKKVTEKNQNLEFKFAANEAERAKLWEGRRGSYAAMARLAPNVLVEDGAVPRTKLPEALRAMKTIAKTYNLNVAMLFHAGDGNLHPQIIFDERDKEKTKIVKEAGYQMLKACVDLGGTISGEHGIGIDKREAMKWLFSRETLSLFRRLKNVFDPANLCNPDKLIPLVGKGTDREPPPKKKDEQAVSLGLVKPASEEECIETVRRFAADKSRFGIQGLESRYKLKEDLILNVSEMAKVLDFDKGNLSITVQAGAPLVNLRKFLEKEGQYLWVGGSGSVGGVVATKGSSQPPLRDQILGMRVLLANGDIVQFGAKTMKNVAGYDTAKLMIGSWGTLGLILDVTFRLFPYPKPLSAVEEPKPFVLKEIHKKIKSAFDPGSLLAPRLCGITVQPTESKSEMMNGPDAETFRRFEKDYWG